MKKSHLRIVILIIIFESIFNVSYATDFNIIPLTMDFNGVVISGTNIIAYSDNGAYLITTDRGKSWKQHSIFDYGSVELMIDKEDALWGVIDIGIILKSTDNGLNWIPHKFELDEGDTCKYMAVSDDFLFIRTKDKIIRFDKDFNYLNEYQNSILFCDTLEYKGHEFYLDPFLFMTYINNRLIVSVSHKQYNGNGDLFIFDEALNLMDTVDLNECIKGFSLIRYIDFYGFELKNVFKYHNDNVCIIKYLPFIVNEDFTEWRYFYDNSEICKSINGTTNHNLFIPNYLNNNILYHGYKTRNESIRYFRPYSSSFSTIIYTLGITKYNSQADFLELIGNIFDNSFFTSQSIGPVKADAIYFSLFSKSFVVLEDSVVVWRGYKKTLLQSRDMAENWELVSHLSNARKPSLIINDSMFYYFDFISKQITRTKDGGQTFLPVKIDTNEHIPHFQDYGYGPFIFCIDESGKGIFTASFPFGVIYSAIPEFAYTEDYGRTFTFVHRDSMRLSRVRGLSNIIDKQNKFLVALNYQNADSCRIITFTKDNFEYEFVSVDTTMTIHHILAVDLQHFFAFAKVKPNDVNNYETFEVKETNDGSQTWNTICKIDQSINPLHFYQHNKDSVFISALNPNRIYLYDRTRNCFDTLFTDDVNTYKNLQLMCISDHFFITADSLFLENSDRQDLSQWKLGGWDYGTPYIKSLLFKGNIALAEFSDAKRTLGHYKITLDNTISVKTENIENSQIAHFYAAKPYPNPANNTVKVKVYWDANYKLENAWMSVYDILGQDVGSKQELSVNNIQAYSGEIIWDCSLVNSGIYFIVLDYLGQMRSIPVVVGK